MSGRLGFTLYADVEHEPRKHWIVEGFFGEGELSCSFGAPSAGKSVIVGDRNAHIAAGLKWFERRVEKCAVLHVAVERAAVVKRRYAAFRKHHKLDDLPLAIVNGAVDLRTSINDAKQLADCCKQLEDITGERVGFISIETVNRVLAGGDENSPKDMGALVDRVSWLQETTGAGIDLVHHIPADGSQRLRGHGALLGAMDVTGRVEKLSDKTRAYTVDKANDGIEGERVTFTLQSVELHFDPETGIATTAPVVIPAEAPAEGVAKANGVKLSPNQSTFLSLLREGMPNGLTLEEWNTKARVVGIGVKRDATFYDLREALRSKHLVHSYADRWYASH